MHLLKVIGIDLSARYHNTTRYEHRWLIIIIRGASSTPKGFCTLVPKDSLSESSTPPSLSSSLPLLTPCDNKASPCLRVLLASLVTRVGIYIAIRYLIPHLRIFCYSDVVCYYHPHRARLKFFYYSDVLCYYHPHQTRLKLKDFYKYSTTITMGPTSPRHPNQTKCFFFRGTKPNQMVIRDY